MWKLLQKIYQLVRQGFKKETEIPYTLAFTLQNEELVFAYFEPLSHALIQYGSVEFSKEELPEITLAGLAQEKKLKSTECIYILPPSDYQLLLVNKPNTPDEELKTSLRWVIKGFIEESVDLLIIDYFLLPKGHDQKQKLYVATTEIEKIKKINQLLRHAGFRLKQVSIPELSLLNLCNNLPHHTDSLAMLVNDLQKTFIMLIEQQEIRFIRTLKSTNENELCEEIHRTFDYYHAQLGNTIPKKIFLDPYFATQEELIKKLSTDLALPIENIDLNKVVHAIPPIHQEEQARYLNIIGTANSFITAKQSINLGNSFVKTENIRFSFLQMLLISIALFVLLLTTTSYHLIHFYSLKNKANQISKEKNSLTSSIAQLAKKYQSLVSVVGSSKEDSPANASKKQALANILKNYVQPEAQKKRFSSYLTNLSETTPPPIWFEKIHIENNTNLLLLQGRALSTDNIMDFNKKLNEMELFKNFHPRPFDIKKAKEESAFSFNIQDTKEEQEETK